MSRGKISDLFFEVGYKVNPTGFKRVEDDLKKIGIYANTSGVKIEKLGGILTGISGQAGSLGTTFTNLGSALGAAASMVLPFAAIGTTLGFITNETIKSVNAISEFDDKLRTVVAKIGASEEQLKELSPVTRQVARDYHVMANSVAEAQDYLALAGYSLEEIQEGTEAVVAAQRATGESMKAVSDIATDTASAYGYSADKLEFIVDRMTYTTTKFNTGFAQMGEAMKYIAPIAKQAGMEFEDLNAYIGVLANNSIKGSQAGTALRMAFLRLQAPSKAAQAQLNKYGIALYNAKGEYLGINKVMLNIEKAMKKMTDKQKAMFKQTVFGTEAMSAMEIVLKEGVENIIAYGDAIGQADGKTREMAMFMENGLGGLKRAIESEKNELSLALGEALRPAAYLFLNDLKEGMEDLNQTLDENKETVSDFALVIGGTIRDLNDSAAFVLKPVIWLFKETGSFLLDVLDFMTFGLYDDKVKYERKRLEELEWKERAEKFPREIIFPELENISLSDMELPSYKLPGEHYYKNFFIEEEPKELNINIKINGTDTLGKDVATAISEEVQKSFEEAMNYELSTTNINLGRGFSY